MTGRWRRLRCCAVAAGVLGLLPACHLGSAATAPDSAGGAARPAATGALDRSLARVSDLPGMPPPLDPADVYAADRPGRISPVLHGVPERVYVPNSVSNTVSVIDPATGRILRTVRVGREPQHVVPAWNLGRLWVNSDLGNSLTPIDPRTGAFGRPVAVTDPYNLYFTPDGKYAVVMAERKHRIDFRNPATMALHDSTPVPCSGVNHADFSADGRNFLVSCEFSGQILKVDTETHRVVGDLRLPDAGSMPQDVKLSPDGRVFYVADMMAGGVWMLDGNGLTITGFIRTGRGAHGLYITRDSRRLLVTNRGEGSIGVIDLATRKMVARWRIPHGGSPDMGGLSPDGRTFWVSGRYNAEVYAIDVGTGHLVRRIRVGSGPHGLCIYPQPGRYSLGHTGVLR